MVLCIKSLQKYGCYATVGRQLRDYSTHTKHRYNHLIKIIASENIKNNNERFIQNSLDS